MKDVFRILVINPGSTSTKLALYENEACVKEESSDIDPAAIKDLGVFGQYGVRMEQVRDFLLRAEEERDGRIDAVAARGCGGGNQRAGAYLIDDGYLALCRSNGIPHISNLSPILAHDIALERGIPAYVYDAEGVNERDGLTLLSGIRELRVNSGSHVLNAKMVARKAAEKIGKSYEDATVVVCHMGGGVSSSCHKNGRLIDSVYDSYAPERAGGIPGSAALNFVELCFSGRYTAQEIKRLLMGRGGLVSYLGVSDLREVERRMDGGDKEAEFYFNGMALGLSKDIASVCATVNMDVDAIALTGGMAHSERLTREITRRTGKIAPVLVFSGSYETESLAHGALRVLRGEEEAHLYGKDDGEGREKRQ